MKQEKILSYAAALGTKFDLDTLQQLTNIDLHKILHELENKEFEKIDEFQYKFKSIDYKKELLKSKEKTFKTEVLQKEKEIKIKSIFLKLKNLYISETKQMIKDSILSFLITFCEYLVNINYIKNANLYLEFIINHIYIKSEFYEKALFLKANLMLRKQEFEKAENLCKKIEINPEYLIQKNELLVSIYFEQGKKEEISKVFQEWDNHIELDNYTKKINKILNYSKLLYKTSEYSKAIEILLDNQNEILEFEKKYNNTTVKKVLADFYNQLGIFYFQIEEYSKSLDYLTKSVEKYKMINFKRELLSPYNNIAEIYKHYKKLDKALNIYKSIYQNAQSLGNKEILAISIWNMGETYYSLNKFDKAEEYFKQAEKTFIESGTYSKYDVYMKIYFGKLYMKLDKFEEAEEYINDVLISAFEKGQSKEYADALIIKGKLVARNKKDPSSFFDEAIEIFNKMNLKTELKQTEKLKAYYINLKG